MYLSHRYISSVILKQIMTIVSSNNNTCYYEKVRVDMWVLHSERKLTPTMRRMESLLQNGISR